MVVIHVKNRLEDGFLYETTTDCPNSELISKLVQLHNLRLLATSVAESVRGLALYGPLKSQTERSALQVAENINHPHYNEDPTGHRNGKAPNPTVVATMEQEVTKLEQYISKQQVQRKVALEVAPILDLLANVRGSVMMAYPMGLPEHDITKQLLDYIASIAETAKSGKDQHTPTPNDRPRVKFNDYVTTDSNQKNSNAFIQGLLDPNTTSLWVAGKEFHKSTLVRDRLGSNEKTKVIAKLQGVGQGAPVREPMVSEEEQKVMLAHYFKRQEELKRLAECDEDDYLHSAWADPKGLQRSLHQLNDSIKAPGLSRPL